MVVASQAAAAAVLLLAVLATGGWADASPALWYAVAAGVIGPFAILAFYRALALGPMGVVSPLADVAANGTYAMASHGGSAAVAAVLASLYPVVTALMARGVLKERLRPVQVLGAGLAVAGTLLLAAS